MKIHKYKNIYISAYFAELTFNNFLAQFGPQFGLDRNNHSGVNDTCTSSSLAASV